MSFLPINPAELQQRGWAQPDIILISGDAYVDHPSFGIPLIGRVLEAMGFKVGIIAQPSLTSDEDLLRLGRPRLFFGVSSGNMDSMVNHYTAQRKLRNDDAYSPDGAPGLRPDRAVIVYTNHLRRLFKDIPVVLGGMEASMRRLAHYDFWQDKIRSSILADSKADILVYGMGERAIMQIARALDAGNKASELKDIPGTVVFASKGENPEPGQLLPSDADSVDKQSFWEGSRLFWAEQDRRVLYQENGGRQIRHNPPAHALSEKELDEIYALPFERNPHPVYAGRIIPAAEQIRHSITSHRGCYGGCNFCAISAHQGKRIISRSAASIKAEARLMAKSKKKGKLTITDIGGPTANMYGSYCKNGWPLSCRRDSCLFPKICPNLVFDHSLQLKLLENVEAIPNVGHVYVASGIRHDMAVTSPDYIKAMAAKYAGGRLKLAPEHSDPAVLRLMGKPGISSYEDFSSSFYQACRQMGLKRQIIPYLIVGHPGSDISSARALSRWLQQNRIRVEQIQEFTPTPMTKSTCMYYTGLDFETGEPINIPRPSEIRKQKNIIFNNT